MSDYPDTNKLMFFSCDWSDGDSEYDFESDDEEMLLIKASKKPLDDLVQEGKLSKTERGLVKGTLSWSIKERLSIPEVN